MEKKVMKPHDGKKFIDKDIRESEQLVLKYLNDFLNNFLQKGFIFHKYLHEDNYFIIGDGIHLVIVDTNYKIASSKKNEKNEIIVNVEFTKLANVGFDECDIRIKKEPYKFVLKKQNNKWLILSHPHEVFSYLVTAMNFINEGMNDPGRKTKYEHRVYTEMCNCLLQLYIKQEKDKRKIKLKN